MMVEMVPVYDWISHGRSVGCGTAAEIAYHSEGRDTCGAVLCYEPASEDARRAALWAAERT